MDSDSFIQSQNIYYGFDFCPGFWEWLAHKKNKGIVCSIERVRQELLRFESDDLVQEWAKKRDASFFLPDDTEAVVAAFTEMVLWANSTRGSLYRSSAVDEFLGSTDIWLIAYAKFYGFVVVTQESYSGSPAQRSVKKIKIPDVCAIHKITCINIHDFLRNSGIRLVIEDRYTVRQSEEEEYYFEKEQEAPFDYDDYLRFADESKYIEE